MAEIHQTTLTPGKLELLTGWLPSQPWFSGAAPKLAKVGGFRLDDPAGDVGIEIVIVADRSSNDVVHYVVPLSYRSGPLAGADDALIGTAEHGVLGTRWFYDGARDPVVVAQLLALMAGKVTAQDQNVSFAPDPTVTTRPGTGAVDVPDPQVDPGPVPDPDVYPDQHPGDDPGPDPDLEPDQDPGNDPGPGPAAVTVVRVPMLDRDVPTSGGYVQAEFTAADGSTVRAVIATTP